MIEHFVLVLPSLGQAQIVYCFCSNKVQLLRFFFSSSSTWRHGRKSLRTTASTMPHGSALSISNWLLFSVGGHANGVLLTSGCVLWQDLMEFNTSYVKPFFQISARTQLSDIQSSKNWLNLMPLFPLNIIFYLWKEWTNRNFVFQLNLQIVYL